MAPLKDTLALFDITDQKQAEEDRRAAISARDLTSRLLHARRRRRRIAREMHDDWSSGYRSWASILRRWKRSSAPRRKLFAPSRMQDQLVSLSETCMTVASVHPAILDDLGLVEAMRSEWRRFSRRKDCCRLPPG